MDCQSEGDCGLAHPARRMRALGALGKGVADVGAVVSVVSVSASVPGGWVATAPLFSPRKELLSSPIHNIYN